MKTKIVYAMVASALLFPVTVVANLDGQQKKHPKLIALIQQNDIDKAKRQLSRMIERKTKHIEILKQVQNTLDSNDKEGALSILESLHKKHPKETPTAETPTAETPKPTEQKKTARGRGR